MIVVMVPSDGEEKEKARWGSLAFGEVFAGDPKKILGEGYYVLLI
jgi:hypothetical protein